MDEPLLKIIKNPPQAPKSYFRLTRQIKIRGEAIYIIFAGIVLSVFLFFVLMDSSLIASLLFSWLPLALSFIFYFTFVKDKPKYVKIVPNKNASSLVDECDRLNTLLVKASI